MLLPAEKATKNAQAEGRVKFNLIPIVVAFYKKEYHPALAFEEIKPIYLLSDKDSP